MDWLAAAEACQLETLRSSCLLRLAESVVGWSSNLTPCLAHASLLERCSPRTLTQLLGIVAAAGARPRKARERLAKMLPSASDLGRSLSEAANPGQFEWAIEGFAELPSESGKCVDSPEFTAAGGRHLRRLQLCVLHRPCTAVYAVSQRWQ